MVEPAPRAALHAIPDPLDAIEECYRRGAGQTFCRLYLRPLIVSGRCLKRPALSPNLFWVKSQWVAGR